MKGGIQRRRARLKFIKFNFLLQNTEQNAVIINTPILFSILRFSRAQKALFKRKMLSSTPKTSALETLTTFSWDFWKFLLFVYIDCLLWWCDVSCIIFVHFKMLFPFLLLCFFRICFSFVPKKISLPFENGTPKFFSSQLSEKKKRKKLRRKRCMENQVDDVMCFLPILWKAGLSWKLKERKSAPRWWEKRIESRWKAKEMFCVCEKELREKFACEW